MLDQLNQIVLDSIDRENAFLSGFESRFESEASMGGGSSKNKRGGPKVPPNSRDLARIDSQLLNQVEDGLTELTDSLKKDYGSEISTLSWLIILALCTTLAVTFVKVNSAVNKVHLF